MSCYLPQTSSTGPSNDTELRPARHPRTLSRLHIDGWRTIKNPGSWARREKMFKFYCGFPVLGSYLIDKSDLVHRQRNCVSGRVVGGTQHRAARVTRWLASWLMVALLSTASIAAEPSAEPLFDIDIPPMNAAEALNRLAKQTGAVMLFPYDLAESRQANAVSGRYSLSDALELLLRDSGPDCLTNV